MTQVYCVQGGWNYEGENIASLRVFDCKSTAEKYKEQITEDYDYVLMITREVIMGSTFEEVKE